MKKIVLALAIVIAIVAVILYFVLKPPPVKEVVVYGTTEKVTDMDPANAYDFHTWEIFYNIYQGLMGYPAGKPNLVPNLAEKYEVVDDGKGYVFTLKEGVKFSDGTPFEREDVAFAV